MFVVKSYEAQQSGRRTEQVTERDRVARLIRTAVAAGIRVDPDDIINFYVSLKSKSLLILAGPAQSGKTSLIQSLTRVLVGESLQCQIMDGHAWWAGHTDDVALFTEAQTRFTTAKILALIEEALQPENVNRVFIACLTHISPAELDGYFSEVASQLRHRQIMRLPGATLVEPIPYPPNLFLLGTMDTTHWDWSDADLLSKATIIHWSAVETGLIEYPVQTAVDYPADEAAFLQACIRREKNARQRLHRILGNLRQALVPLITIEYLVACWGTPLSEAVTDEFLIYLANAWSSEGAGLFDEVPSNNLAIAMDFAISQTILSRVAGMVRESAALRLRLHETLRPYPRSAAYFESLI